MKWWSEILTAIWGEDRPIARRSDPEFGEMWRNTYNAWRSRMLFPPTGTTTSLYFRDANDEGPTEWQRMLFRELINRYDTLCRDMEEPLRREYEEIRTSWDLSSPEVAHPGDIWRIAYLFAIEVNGEGQSIDVALHYEMDWENEDHDLNIRLKDWKVLKVAMEG